MCQFDVINEELLNTKCIIKKNIPIKIHEMTEFNDDYSEDRRPTNVFVWY